MRTERFIRAYDALVKAFFEGTLFAGACQCCAVGNIVLAAGNGTYEIRNGFPYPSFDNTLWSPCMSGNSQVFDNKTGYTQEELLMIERAFERNSKHKAAWRKNVSESELLEDQYNGLAAVVDVLLKLDNISPEDHYKNKFREHPQLV